MIWGEIIFILCLVCLNGFFAMAEMAVVSARRPRLKAMAEKGHRGAGLALELARHPERFLPAVQIGISVVGVLAGAFGGAHLSGPVAVWLAHFPSLDPWREQLALALVVAPITYVSLVAGELAPKQLALRQAESIAAFVARPMTWLARIAAPLVWLLDLSTRAVLLVTGGHAARPHMVSEEEVRMLVAEAHAAGAIARGEQDMIAAVMRLADKPLQSLMTPRRDVVFLDLGDDRKTVTAKLRANDFSRFPVRDGDDDRVVGIVQAKTVLDQLLDGRAPDVAASMVPAPVVHENARPLDAMEVIKKSPVKLAVVVDEFGGMEGIISITDLLDVVVDGALGTDPDMGVLRRPDGSYLIDGVASAEEVGRQLGIGELPGDGYETVAGLFLALHGHVPAAGDRADWDGWWFEVVDMDGPRIDKLLAGRRRARDKAEETGGD